MAGSVSTIVLLIIFCTYLTMDILEVTLHKTIFGVIGGIFMIIAGIASMFIEGELFSKHKGVNILVVIEGILYISAGITLFVLKNKESEEYIPPSVKEKNEK